MGLRCRNVDVRTRTKDGEIDEGNLMLENPNFPSTVSELLKEFWMIFSFNHFSSPYNNFSPRFDQ